jgi:hypothetical protein
LFGRSQDSGNGRPVKVIDLVSRWADLCPPASDVFDADELEERIRMHSERVLAEVQRIDAEVKRRSQLKHKKARKVHLPNWVKVSNCYRCGRLLVCKYQPDHPLKDRGQKCLAVMRAMPKVAGHVGDRPSCKDCLPLEEAA